MSSSLALLAQFEVAGGGDALRCAVKEWSAAPDITLGGVPVLGVHVVERPASLCRIGFEVAPARPAGAQGSQRRRLRALSFASLRRKALRAGVDGRSLLLAADSPDPRSNLVDLLLQRDAFTRSRTASVAVRSLMGRIERGARSVRVAGGQILAMSELRRVLDVGFEVLPPPTLTLTPAVYGRQLASDPEPEPEPQPSRCLRVSVLGCTPLALDEEFPRVLLELESEGQVCRTSWSSGPALWGSGAERETLAFATPPGAESPATVSIALVVSDGRADRSSGGSRDGENAEREGEDEGTVVAMHHANFSLWQPRWEPADDWCASCWCELQTRRGKLLGSVHLVAAWGLVAVEDSAAAVASGQCLTVSLQEVTAVDPKTTIALLGANAQVQVAVDGRVQSSAAVIAVRAPGMRGDVGARFGASSALVFDDLYEHPLAIGFELFAVDRHVGNQLSGPDTRVKDAAAADWEQGSGSIQLQRAWNESPRHIRGNSDIERKDGEQPNNSADMDAISVADGRVSSQGRLLCRSTMVVGPLLLSEVRVEPVVVQRNLVLTGPDGAEHARLSCAIIWEPVRYHNEATSSGEFEDACDGTVVSGIVGVPDEPSRISSMQAVAALQREVDAAAVDWRSRLVIADAPVRCPTVVAVERLVTQRPSLALTEASSTVARMADVPQKIEEMIPPLLVAVANGDVRWCKLCRVAFAGVQCAQGHGSYRYTHHVPANVLKRLQKQSRAAHVAAEWAEVTARSDAEAAERAASRLQAIFRGRRGRRRAWAANERRVFGQRLIWHPSKHRARCPLSRQLPRRRRWQHRWVIPAA